MRVTKTKSENKPKEMVQIWITKSESESLTRLTELLPFGQAAIDRKRLATLERRAHVMINGQSTQSGRGTLCSLRSSEAFSSDSQSPFLDRPQGTPRKSNVECSGG